jgi:large subunit ribosomal protein L29
MTMKKSQITELSTEELLDRISEEKAQFNRLKLSHAVSPIESPSKINHSRKTIARLLTENAKRQAINN